MSIFKRVGQIWRSNKTAPEAAAARPLEEAQVGDAVTLDLEEYVITGKVTYFDRGYAPHRYAYYLQSGKAIRCLLVQKGRTYDCFLCDFLEGALNDPNDVPSRLVLDEQPTFDLEHHRSDLAKTEGDTDFRSGDEVLFWHYFGPDDRYFFLQWQDGKFVALEGERTQGSQIRFYKASR